MSDRQVRWDGYRWLSWDGRSWVIADPQPAPPPGTAVAPPPPPPPPGGAVAATQSKPARVPVVARAGSGPGPRATIVWWAVGLVVALLASASARSKVNATYYDTLASGDEWTAAITGIAVLICAVGLISAVLRLARSKDDREGR